jgi:hypothetical protein
MLIVFTPSVVVDNFHVFGPCVRPAKAYTPLIINTDTVLPLSVACERLKAIAWRRLQELQRCGCLKLSELTSRNFRDRSEALRLSRLEELAGKGAFKALYHGE